MIPEGLTIKQIADVAKEAGLKGDYEQAVDKAAKSFPLKKYDASDAADMEGFLFPAPTTSRRTARSTTSSPISCRPSRTTSTRSTSSTRRRRT